MEEAAAKKRYEQACAEADAAEEKAEKCRQKRAQAKDDLEKKQEEARMLRRKGRATTGPAAEWVVDVSEQFQVIERYAQKLGHQGGEGLKKETEAAMAQFRKNMERAAEQLREGLRQKQNVEAQPRIQEIEDDDDLGLLGGDCHEAGRPEEPGRGRSYGWADGTGRV
jgi:hypothetical protein